MNKKLTARAKSLAYSLGADLVGVGNIERWKNCPLLMSPAGILPSAKSVLVCGIHHTDAMIEIGGENSPHEQGTYGYQGLVNAHLDCMSYDLGRFLEDEGFRTVPICASNIWRYREYKGLKATFAPDMSHIYASVAAGLTELGFSGLAMSPEYGPRNRFVSIITDASLVPTPLLPGNTLCDHCGMCAKHCPTHALTEELGEKVKLEIEGRQYPFANKNLWRCSWGEHFGLDVDAEIPKKVDEAVILEKVAELGMRGGTMGCCIKYCLPKERRTWDKKYSSAPIRKKEVIPASPKPLRSMQEKIIADAFTGGVDMIQIDSWADWKERGCDIRTLLPDAESVIMFGVRYPQHCPVKTMNKQVNFAAAANYLGRKAAFFSASSLEKLGYSGAPYQETRLSGKGGEVLKALGDALRTEMDDEQFFPSFVVTSAVLTPDSQKAGSDSLPPDVKLTDVVKTLAYNFGADVVGVSSADRIDALKDQLTDIFAEELILNARETGKLWLNSIAEVTETRCEVFSPTDYLTGAKSVILLGMRLPKASVERTCKEPAEAIGPYAFAAYQSQRSLNQAVLKLVKTMNGWGMKTAVSYDLCGTGSLAANPRGSQPNAFCNRFAAVCAGLGTLTKGGFVNNPKFGPHLRYVAIVTDVELDEDEVTRLTELRRECDNGCNRCVCHCTVDAFKDAVNITIAGEALAFHPVEQVRCDWALRYGLIPDEGIKYTGSTSNVPIPAEVTAEALSIAMTKRDKILKIRPCVAEMCMMACPYVRTQ